jgi:hypothetical protein
MTGPAMVESNRAAASTQPFGAIVCFMFDKSYLKSTGQMWKFYLFFMAFPLVGLALIGMVLKGMLGERVNLLIFLALLGLGLAAAGFVLGVITVQCPKCNARLLWKAVREQSHQNWFNWLMGLSKCPVCHNSIGRS